MSKTATKVFFTGHSLYGFPRKTRKTKYQVEVSLRGFEAKSIRSGCCGALHVIFLVEDGSVYGVGNNEYGQLGLEKKKILSFTKIPLPRPAVMVDASDTHSAFLLDDGTIYMCGLMDHSDAFKSIKNKRPAALPVPSSVQFKLVKCGYKRVYGLSESGSLYGIGNNHCGVLGTGKSELFVESFKKMKFSKAIRAISCGKDHTVVLGDDGRVYGLGSDEHGQLGLLRRRQSYGVPTNIPTLDKKGINRIESGSHHTVFLSGTKKSVFVTGRNNMGQLGLGHVRDCGQPTQLFHYRFAGKASIVNVFCGHTFTFFLSSSDKVYGCGKNESGQLGIGTLLKPYQPFEVKGASGTRGIICGRSFSFHIRGQRKKRGRKGGKGRRRPSKDVMNQSLPVGLTEKINKIEHAQTIPPTKKTEEEETEGESGGSSIPPPQNPEQQQRIIPNKKQEEKIQKLEQKVKNLKIESHDLKVRLKKYEDPSKAKFYDRLTKLKILLENQVQFSSKQKDFEKCMDIQKILKQLELVEDMNKESVHLIATLENSQFLFK